MLRSFFALAVLAFSTVAAADTIQLEGRAIQGGLVVGRTDPSHRVTLDGRPIRMGRDGTFLLALSMDAPATLELAIEGPDGGREVRTLQVEQRTFETERVDGLPDEEVNLDRRARAALGRSHREIDRLRRRFTPEAHFSGGFDWPARGRITSRFGVRRILNGEPRARHDAVDIAVPIGTSVRAPAAGVVVFARDDVPLAGRTIVIDHGLGLTSTFLHLNAIRAVPGQHVPRGAIVGLSGNTGRTTGPHLEWSVHLLGVALDPELLSPAAPPERVSARMPPGERRAARDRTAAPLVAIPGR